MRSKGMWDEKTKNRNFLAFLSSNMDKNWYAASFQVFSAMPTSIFKLQPLMSDVWWKFLVNWKRRTKVTHFPSLTFCHIDHPFNYTFNNNKSLYLSKKSMLKVENVRWKSRFRLNFVSFYPLNCPKMLGWSWNPDKTWPVIW